MLSRQLYWTEVVAAAGVALAGVLATAGLFQWVRDWEFSNTEAHFVEQAQATAASIERNLKGAHEDLMLLRELFDRRNGEVSREEFRLYTASLLKRAPFVQGFSLHRIVLGRDRAAFEKKRAGEFPGFRIRQIRNGEVQLATERPFYRVIDYIEPFEVHRSAQGHDAHVVGRATATAALTAEASRKPQVSPLLSLPYINEYGFLIFMPLYYTGAMPAGWERNRAYAFAVAIFAVGVSVRKTLQMSDSAPFYELKLYGKDAKGWVEAFTTPPSSLPRFSPLPVIGRLYHTDDLRYRHQFSLLNTPWQLTMAGPRPDPMQEHIGSLLTLLVGMLSTVVLSLYTWATLSYKRRIGNLVAQRTLELNDANARLQDDVARREAYNRILHFIASGASLSLILDEILDVSQSQTGGCPGAVLLVDGSAHAPHLPPPLVHALCADDNLRRSVLEGRLRWFVGATDDVRLASATAQVLTSQGIKALAAWPIVGKSGDCLGALILFCERAHDPFPEVEQMAEASTSLMGIAIEGRRAEEHVRHLAHHDELTGLPNRLLFTDSLRKRINKAERSGTRLAVMFLDLDRFKYINDHFGHNAGDDVLRMVAAGFRSCLRAPDLLARIGGDEFMLMVDEFRESRELNEVAERLVQEASRPFQISGQDCHMGVSIGIAAWPEDGADAVALMKNADIAMYRAKSSGRNNYRFYSAEMNSFPVSRLALESGLRRALDWNEIVVYYQPKISVATGKPVGLEALVRWQHLDKGLILPADFVPFAEEIGLISTIGMQVLRSACADLLRMRDQGVDLGRVAINLSGSQFNDEHLVEDIHTAIEAAGVSPDLLEFEITESMVMHNPERALRLMHELRALGITLSIDDFGTGYSSLASLRRLPVNSLKVDRSFIEDLQEGESGRAIVHAIIDMAHTLGLRVIAEGVQTQEQLQVLRQVGCDEYQGFLHSEPVPAQRLMDEARGRFAA